MPETSPKDTGAKQRSGDQPPVSRDAGAPRQARESGASGDFDTQLMLAARAGDREAANTLIHRNFERIARYLARLVGPHRPVEDLAQDVFLQALTHSEHYQPSAKVSTWLYRIATNTALNYLKQPSVRRRSPELPEGRLEVVDHSEPAPDRQMSLNELQREVRAAVRELPLKQQVALALFEYEDCSYAQIAAVLDCTVESVRSLLMRARTTLRGRLRELT